MELVPAVTAWLDSRMRVLKKNVSDLVTDPIGHVEKQVYNTLSDTATFVDKANEDPMKWVEGLAGNGVVGAFRPVGSKLLPSTLATPKNYFAPTNMAVQNNGWNSVSQGFSPLDAVEELIAGKLSPKVLDKYGAPDFPLDAYLGHVRGVPEGSSAAYYLKELDPFQMTQADMRWAIHSARTNLQNPELQGAWAGAAKDDLKAIRDSLRYKTPLYSTTTMRNVNPSSDISTGIMNLTDALASSPYTPDQLSKKSLQQLVSVGLKSEKDRAAAQLKEASVIKDFTISRSAQLNQEQGLPKGFIELKTQQDLGAETEFMNNCVGAGGAHPRTGKFIPKWHPITGEQITKGFAEDSGDQYWKRLQSGNERIFSYRPEGLPVATIRMDTRTGEVIEALGVENRPIPANMSSQIKSFVTQKKAELLGFPLAAKYRQISLEDPFAHNVPRAIGQLIRPRGEGAVQVAAWEAEQAALRAARELNPPHAQIEWEPDGGLFGDF
jgi:hypothetical protein